jgi:hypothetical protein
MLSAYLSTHATTSLQQDDEQDPLVVALEESLASDLFPVVEENSQ